MIYYGPQTIINYDRNFFDPEGDEIILMQQHCGGENLIVYKNALKPNRNKNKLINQINRNNVFF
jgi:hypothetical protein